MARAGEEDLELHYTVESRTHPPPQAAGTVYFAMDVDDVPAALGSRPDRLLDVSGPQERGQRRTVQQIVDPVPLPTLDDPAPQMVGQLVDVLKLLDTAIPEQVFEEPKIPQDSIPHRAVFEPQLAEQLVEVPTAVTFVPGRALFVDRRGHEWVRVPGPTGVVYFWNVSTNDTQWEPPEGKYTASPGRYTNTGQR